MFSNEFGGFIMEKNKNILKIVFVFVLVYIANLLLDGYYSGFTTDVMIHSLVRSGLMTIVLLLAVFFSNRKK